MHITELEENFSPNIKALQGTNYLEYQMRHDPFSDRSRLVNAIALWIAPDNTIIPVEGEHYRVAEHLLYTDWERDNIQHEFSNWRTGMTKDAMLHLFEAGWIRMRKYYREQECETPEGGLYYEGVPKWDIHGKRILKNRGKLRFIARMLVEHELAFEDSEVVLLNEDEGYWGNDASYDLYNLNTGRHMPLHTFL